MIKKLPFIFLTCLLLVSCNEKTNSTIVASEKKNTIVVEKISPTFLHLLSDSLQLYYKKNNNRLFWNNKKNKDALINEIKNCQAEGLNPEDYYNSKIEKFITKNNSTTREIIAFDTLLTAAYKKLATHLYGGKVNPKNVYFDWDLTKNSIALSDSLIAAITTERLKSNLENFKPQHPAYRSIKKGLSLLNQFPDKEFNKISIAKKIVLNDSALEVIAIKKRLKYWKDFTSNDSIISPIYDSITQIAIKKFQKRHGLTPDGIIGTETIKALNISKSERHKQIVANLERWRWFPKNFGNEYLLVNLPDYSLKYIVDNQVESQHTVIVGRKSRRTPVLISQLSYMVFNPTWTVPPTIVKKDLTPKARYNRSYFMRKNMTIYSRSGERILPENWNPDQARSYRYVQAPSAKNSLGLVKFIFPNKRLVYLHDTNNKSYFSLENKALSSGCIRVKNPFELSEKILANEDKEFWNRAEIDSIIKRKHTHRISLNIPIDVYLLYWTNWSENNELIFRNDIYALDKKLYNALRD